MSPSRVPLAILEHWYVCGRKTKYASETIAWMHLRELRHAWQDAERAERNVRYPYACDRCDWYHIGRPTVSTKPDNHQRRRDRLANMRRAWTEQAYR